MKIFALFLSLAVTTSTLVLAEDCTMAELTTISSIYSTAAGDSCPDMTTTTGSADYCSYEDCVKFMSDMLEELPNCSTGDVNVKERVQSVVDLCDSGTADTSNAVTDFSSSSAMTSSSGSAIPTVGTTSSDQDTDDTTSSATSGSLGSSSASPLGFTISSAAIAATAFFAGL